MNRTPIILKPKEKNILEIGLSDVEVIFACQSRIDLEFINDDPKNNPLKLYKIKLYSQSIKDFKLKEKIERHCKEIMK
jgi:glycyl-tRNA synthetase alpha subunit